MATATVCSSWTGTRGRVDTPLPYDWDEADTQLKEKSLGLEESYSTEFVATVWDWGRSIFGKDAEKMTVVELAEYWYEFA